MWWSREGLLDSSGVFDRGRRSGKWTFRDKKNNKQLEGRYEDGALSNLIEVFDNNDQIVLNTDYDTMDKEWTEWYSNGEKRVEVSYEAGGDNSVGKGSGTWSIWFENGNDKMTQSFTNGKPEGKWSEWFESGTDKKEYNWADGKLNGKYTEWFESGQEKIEGEYKDGQKDGNWTEYYASGEKKSVESYNCLLYTSPSPRDS